MKKSVLSFLPLVFILIFYGFSAVASSVEVTAQSSVLMCADSGQLLFEKNAEERLPMASTTKIMTAILAIESDRFNQMITVGKEIVGVEGSSLGLREGDRLSMYDLVAGLMLASGNDAANAIAAAVSGSVDAFVGLMNRKAEVLGMQNTHFETPSGLDGKTHFSTAADMAAMTAYAMRNPIFSEICASYTKSIKINDKTVWLKNHNRLLQEYDGLVGVKTGFTSKSGRCLVTAAERNGTLLIAVTLNAPDDWNDHRRLHDYGFQNVDKHCLLPAGTRFCVPVVGASCSSVNCETVAELSYSAVQPTSDIQTFVSVSPFLYAPGKKGDVVGSVYMIKNENIIGKTALVLTEDIELNMVQEEDLSLGDRILHALIGWFLNG